MNPLLLLKFLRKTLQTRYNMAGSDKLVAASFANVQGKESFSDHFRNSAVMEQPDENRPRIFHSDGELKGEREKFAKCTDKHRLHRSLTTVNSVGLFPSSKPVSRRNRGRVRGGRQEKQSRGVADLRASWLNGAAILPRSGGVACG